jgi:hypothetical protein
MSAIAANESELLRICLSRLFESSAHPVRLFGRFHQGEIVFISAPDPDISWTRAPGQSAEAFEDMAIDALLELRGLPNKGSARRGGAPTRSYASIGG